MAQESYQNKKNVSREEDLNKIQEEEREFWKEYAELMISKYRDAFLHLPHYQNELKVINEFINPQKGQKWLDLGCGSLPVTELILEKSKGEVEVIAGDIHLEPAKKRLSELGNPSSVKLQYIDLSQKLPFPDNYFDGIVSSKVIPYILEFEGIRGKDGLRGVFQEIYRILKPGGVLIWSYMQKMNNFKGILISIGYILNPYQWIKRKVFLPLYAIKTMNFFKSTEEKTNKGIYHVFPQKEYSDLLTSIGFENLEWKESFGGMTLVNKAEK